MDIKGTEETKSFYDSEGWQVSDEGTTLDEDLFGLKENGPIRIQIAARLWHRISDGLEDTGATDFLEVGCGGSPETRFLDIFENYVGCDFSSVGLEVAKGKFEPFGSRVKFVEADAVSLPFADGSFDTVYSAHMLYHIVNRASQAAAIQEMLRVLRPGGRLVLVTANPRPLLFPMRLMIRLIADAPMLAGIARKLKGPSPVPYNPSKIRWYRRQIEKLADVGIFTGGIASTNFNQSVTEHKGIGKLAWSFICL
jgi:ubiquinone/menaquinone biosynthesis C-methylase UbiE